MLKVSKSRIVNLWDSALKKVRFTCFELSFKKTVSLESDLDDLNDYFSTWRHVEEFIYPPTGYSKNFLTYIVHLNLTIDCNLGNVDTGIKVYHLTSFKSNRIKGSFSLVRFITLCLKIKISSSH
jgi:hypothetical protein